MLNDCNLLCSGSLLLESVDADLDDAFELTREVAGGVAEGSGVFAGLVLFLKKSNIYKL